MLRRSRPPVWLATVVVVALLGGLGAACENRSDKAPHLPLPSESSPTASILPAPLVSVETPSVARDAGIVADGLADAGPETPRFAREDEPAPEDAPLRDASGVRLDVRMSWLDLPPFPRLPHANVEVASRLRETLAFDVSFELAAAGRLRARFASDAFVLPRGAELRSRSDRLGHVLLWDRGSTYAVVPAGGLRALLNEHRADVTPLVTPKTAELGQGGWLGLSTSKSELSTALGRLQLEQARVAGAGSGAELLCRFLAELVAADPLTPVCARGLLPLRAELASTSGGRLLFEVRALDRDQLLEAADLLTPPATGRFVPGELPAPGPAIVLEGRRLAELRSRATTRSERPDPSAPAQGLVIDNRSESLRYVLLDGVVLARVAPRGQVHVESLLPGKYALASLDFLGSDPTPLHIVELPARVALGDTANDEH